MLPRAGNSRYGEVHYVALVTDWNTFSIMRMPSVTRLSVEVLMKALYQSKDVQHARGWGALL